MHLEVFDKINAKNKLLSQEFKFLWGQRKKLSRNTHVYLGEYAMRRPSFTREELWCTSREVCRNCKEIEMISVQIECLLTEVESSLAGGGGGGSEWG